MVLSGETIDTSLSIRMPERTEEGAKTWSEDIKAKEQL